MYRVKERAVANVKELLRIRKDAKLKDIRFYDLSIFSTSVPNRDGDVFTREALEQAIGTLRDNGHVRSEVAQAMAVPREMLENRGPSPIRAAIGVLQEREALVQAFMNSRPPRFF